MEDFDNEGLKHSNHFKLLQQRVEKANQLESKLENNQKTQEKAYNGIQQQMEAQRNKRKMDNQRRREENMKRFQEQENLRRQKILKQYEKTMKPQTDLKEKQIAEEEQMYQKLMKQGPIKVYRRSHSSLQYDQKQTPTFQQAKKLYAREKLERDRNQIAQLCRVEESISRSLNNSK